MLGTIIEFGVNCELIGVIDVLAIIIKFLNERVQYNKDVVDTNLIG